MLRHFQYRRWSALGRFHGGIRGRDRQKSEYRRFAIRGADGQGALDDLSALYETLTRRFQHGNIAGDSGESMDNERRASEHGDQTHEPTVQQNTNRHHFAYKPNLVVVDGGKPQVMAAAKARGLRCG